MVELGVQACDFCGTEKISNSMLRTDRTVEYTDGPPSASVPNMVLCHDCADDVSDYLEARTSKSNEGVDGAGPFSEADAQALMDRLEENEHLVLTTGKGYGYGIRAIDGEWKHAVFPVPEPERIETLTRKEVQERILNTKRLTLKQLDSSAWKRFERER